MTDRPIRNRLVFHIGGYDPAQPETVHHRFVRELRRFEHTWSAAASVSDLTVDTDTLRWEIDTSGANWRVHTRYDFVRWDDVMEAVHRRPMWLRVPLGFLSLAEFFMAGAFWGYLRTAWRYGLFFLYPIVLVAVFGTIAGAAGLLLARASGSASLGAIASLAAFVGLLTIAARRFFLAQVCEDWILVIGHSIGAVLAIDLLDRALKREPALGCSGPRVGLVSLGSSILKIGLHREAERLRGAVKRVGESAGLFWVEYQVVTDVMNFYKSDPMAALGWPANGRPVVRVVRFRDMLDPAAYRRIRRNFFRLHNQFIRGNDRRAAYDYFMLVCGPLAVERQVYLPQGINSVIGDDGAMRRPPADEWPTHVSPVRLARQ
jgi:hypothetical protein